MITPEFIVLSVIVVWLIVAAVVMGYPLVTGRIRVGLNTVNRNDDPGAFWKAYVLSTALFVGVSAVTGIFMHSILR